MSEEKNEVIAQDDHLPSNPMEVGIGFDDVDPDDLVIPRMKIVQPVSKEGSPGNFRDTASGDEFRELNGVVILSLKKSRRYFAQAGDSHPTCASDDMKVPAAHIKAKQAAECAACPLSQWTNDPATAGRVPPACAEAWNMLIVHEGLPYWMSFSGAAMKDVRKFITALRLRASKFKANLFDFQTDFHLVERTFDRGRAFMPVFKNIGVHEDPVYRDLYEAYAKAAPSQAREPEAEVADEEPAF